MATAKNRYPKRNYSGPKNAPSERGIIKETPTITIKRQKKVDENKNIFPGARQAVKNE